MSDSALLAEKKLELIEVIASLQEQSLVDQLLEFIHRHGISGIAKPTPAEELAMIRERIELARAGYGIDAEDFLKDLDA